MRATFDFWTIIFLIAASQGLFLSLLLYIKRSRANNLLALLILLFTLCLFYYVSFWSGISHRLPFFFSITLGFTYLIGPLLYFYIRYDHTGSFFNIRHFIPFGLYIIFYFSYPFLPEYNRVSLNTIQTVFQNIHLLIYAAIIYNWIKKNRLEKNGVPKLYQWRIQILVAFAGYVLSFISYYLLVWTSLLKVEYDYMISLAASFFIYLVGYKGFVNPSLMDYHSKAKYERSTLSESASVAVLSKIKNEVQAQKLYLDSELKLKTLSERLSLSTHHISQVINQLEGKNFSDFINEYRLKEAKSILSDPNKKEAKLIEVAYDTGFNNKTSFNNAFKKNTGMSPSDYRLQQLKGVL